MISDQQCQSKTYMPEPLPIKISTGESIGIGKCLKADKCGNQKLTRQAKNLVYQHIAFITATPMGPSCELSS